MVLWNSTLLHKKASLPMEHGLWWNGGFRSSWLIFPEKANKKVNQKQNTNGGVKPHKLKSKAPSLFVRRRLVRATDFKYGAMHFNFSQKPQIPVQSGWPTLTFPLWYFRDMQKIITYFLHDMFFKELTSSNSSWDFCRLFMYLLLNRITSLGVSSPSFSS